MNARPISDRRALIILGFAAVVAIASTSIEAQDAAQPGATITGKVRIISKRKRPVAPMVIYLESTDPKKRFDPPADQPSVSQKGAKFSPGMIVIARGQTIRFVNDEKRHIEHNVFSRSPSKSFDLGLYPPGEYKSVTLNRPGEIRLF